MQVRDHPLRIQTAIESAIANDIVLVFKPSDSLMLQQGDTQTPSFGSATYYRFYGDRSIEKMIRCIGPVAGLYGQAFVAGMASLFLSHYRQANGGLPPNSRRQAVKEWLDELARGDGGESMPWSITNDTPSHADGQHLEAIVL